MFGEFATQSVFHRCVLGLAQLLAILSSEALGDVNHIKQEKKKRKRKKSCWEHLRRMEAREATDKEARGRKRSP